MSVHSYVCTLVCVHMGIGISCGFFLKVVLWKMICVCGNNSKSGKEVKRCLPPRTLIPLSLRKAMKCLFLGIDEVSGQSGLSGRAGQDMRSSGVWSGSCRYLTGPWGILSLLGLRPPNKRNGVYRVVSRALQADTACRMDRSARAVVVYSAESFGVLVADFCQCLLVLLSGMLRNLET